MNTSWKIHGGETMGNKINNDNIETEIYIDAWEACIKCTNRFWGIEDPVLFCIWCEYLGCNQ